MKKKLDCILLVDDDEPTNYLNKMILDQMKCAQHIHIAESGKEAINFLVQAGKTQNVPENNCLPELIFLDINMPAMNGWEFIDLYKKNIPGKRVIVVMLTTSLNPDDKQQAENTEEIDGFINKPLTQEAVQSILDEYFANHSN